MSVIIKTNNGYIWFMDNHNCRNCGESDTKNFCSNCGEKRYKRIEMKDMVGDFLSNLITLEGPILLTIKELTISPGKMINAYLNGKRKRYYKPFQYYILATTIYFIFFYLWGEEILSMISDIGNTVNAPNNVEINTVQKEMTEFQNKNIKFFSFLQIPIFSWVLWMFYRKKRIHTYTEMLTISLYIMAQNIFLGIIFTFSEFFISGSSVLLGTVFMFFYLPFVLKQLYNQSTIIAILKSTAIYGITFLLYGLLMGIVSLIWAIFFR